MPVIWTEEEVIEIGNIEAEKCPSKDTHRWKDDYSIGDICYCNTWQIIKIISYDNIIAINIHGVKWEFGR